MISASPHRSSYAKGTLWLVLALVVSAVAPALLAQDNDHPRKEQTWGDAWTPRVYSVRDAGANDPAPVFPPFAQLPIIRPLPDPFQFMGGWRDPSFFAWERRRNEIMAAIEKYEIGPVPDCSDCTITANYVPPAAGSGNGSLTVNVTRNGKTLTLTSGVYIPQNMGSGPFPALIPMEINSLNFGGTTFHFPPPTPPDYGSLPAGVFQGLPIATVGFVSTEVAGLTFGVMGHTTDAFYQLYPELCAGTCTGASNSGVYAAWTWGVSRLIDGMEIATHQANNSLPIDMKHLAVTGCSFAGKMALFAGAFDERIALTISQENGGGGAPSWRVSHEIEAQGSVEDVDDTSYDWFGGQMRQFAGDNVFKLPEDHDELMDLVAPRALLETGNTDFYWLSNRSNYVSARATQVVYNTFGIGDRFGFYIDGGHAHCGTLPAEAPAIAGFVNKFMLGQETANTDVEVFPTNPPLNYDYTKLDYSRWTWWWRDRDHGPEGDFGAEPAFPDDWNTGGTVVMSLDKPGPWADPFDGPWPLLVHEGNAVQGGYELGVGGSRHPAATVGVIGAYASTDVRCLDGSSYTLTIPMPEKQTYSVPAGSLLFVPGPGVYQGSATAPACGSGVTRGFIDGAYFSVLGLANGVGNPPLGNGFSTTDSADPLNVTFGCSANGVASRYAAPLTVNFQQ